MTRFETPFGRIVDLDEKPDRFDPGYALVLAHQALEAGATGPGEQQPVSTPWGELVAEPRGEHGIVVSLPRHEITAPRVMTTVAAMRLGIDRTQVDESGMAIQELDVGTRVLVVPVASVEDLTDGEDPPDLAGVPGTQSEMAVSYTRTQRTPYVKLRGRLLGPGDALAGLAAAAMHLVTQQGVRATYPRTRVVGELTGHDGAFAEITVQAKKAGHGPSVQHLFVGGPVAPV
ncbi:MAG: hypothetical protein R3185_04390 [Candidatus Thermoplasmatota archaeon]|nr:hypothetical protein [Candidatus Thermoplasmatota archaeon]